MLDIESFNELLKELKLIRKALEYIARASCRK